ncbi:hypothetical protein CCACVL1_24481 [Corchorus capsularis]|uniref:Uncharacterized protein n=1 Tax=Corchorus capsularis TaxID=210143 RepID=A0A1R3GPL2_COCAP|nr:hypothetical protein CCACVL1_24481 [Corchorus capsularis]
MGGALGPHENFMDDIGDYLAAAEEQGEGKSNSMGSVLAYAFAQDIRLLATGNRNLRLSVVTAKFQEINEAYKGELVNT